MGRLHTCPSVMECADRLLDEVLGYMQCKERALTLNEVECVLNHAQDLNELRALSDLLIQRVPQLDVAEVVELEYAIEQVNGWGSGVER